jgi:hypothetical protein
MLGTLAVALFLLFWISVLMMVQGHLSWMWILPYGVAAFSVYAYRRVRAATTAQGYLWGLAQCLSSLASIALVALPAKF